jgi:hypothetical protein
VRGAGDAAFSLTIDGKTTNTWKRGDVAFIAATSGTSRRTTGKPADFVIVAVK